MSEPEWTLDHTNYDISKGYLTIKRNGVRVADVFPFAKGADQDWTATQARQIVLVMNAVNNSPVGDLSHHRQRPGD